MMKMNVV